MSWISKEHHNGFSNEDIEKATIKIITHLYNYFDSIGILYSTLPDLRIITNINAKEILRKIQTKILLPNGGVFCLMFKLLLKFYSLVKVKETKSDSMALLFKLFMVNAYPKQPKDSDIILRIEKGNAELLKIIKVSKDSKFSDSYFEVNASTDRPLSMKGLVF